MRTLETHLNRHETSASWNFILTMNINFPFVLFNRLTIMKKLPVATFTSTLYKFFFFNPRVQFLCRGEVQISFYHNKWNICELVKRALQYECTLIHRQYEQLQSMKGINFASFLKTPSNIMYTYNQCFLTCTSTQIKIVLL